MNNAIPVDLSELLPGRWRVGATNLPKWISGERFEAGVEFAVVTEVPLVFTFDTFYRDIAGTEIHELGKDRVRADNQVVSRGLGIRTLARSKWSVVGVSDDKSIVVISFARGHGGHAGIDVLVREDVGTEGIRAIIASDAESFGLSAEDFGTLAWF